MKRSLELVVEEIVEEAKLKDKEGEYVHTFMENPAIRAFTGAPDALLTVLKDRPILFLNLLQSNKELDAFWNSFEQIWIILLDNLIEMIGGAYNAATYPFLYLAFHRHYRLISSLAQIERDHGMLGPIFKSREVKQPLLLEALRLDTISIAYPLLSRHTQPQCYSLSRYAEYWIIYYDEAITKQFVYLLHLLESLFPLAPVFSSVWLNTYINLPEYERFVFFTDFMLTDSEENARAVSYNLQRFRIEVNGTADELASFTLSVNGQLLKNDVVLRGDYPRAVIDSLLEARDLARKLQLRLLLNPFAVTPLVIPPPVPLRLTPEIARPFRDLLFDKKIGLYPDVAQQKQLFLQTLNEVSRERVDEFRASFYTS